MTSNLGARPADDAGPAQLARPAASAGAADPGATDPGAADPGAAVSPRRRARAALLNASALVATTAAFAAFDAKLPRYVGD
jgi:hypothetical protein